MGDPISAIPTLPPRPPRAPSSPAPLLAPMPVTVAAVGAVPIVGAVGSRLLRRCRPRSRPHRRWLRRCRLHRLRRRHTLGGNQGRGEEEEGPGINTFNRGKTASNSDGGTLSGCLFLPSSRLMYQKGAQVPRWLS
ncbi:unnamed protein product [Urochloa humidicola]